MSASTATTAAQRTQALRQLQSAFGQPDGSMIFTYHGNIYQTINTPNGPLADSHGSLQLRNIVTGQINTFVDPVDIYEAAIPFSPPPPPPPPPSYSQSRIMQQISQQWGTISGLANMASSWAAKASAPLRSATAGYAALNPDITVQAAPSFSGSLYRFFNGVGGSILGIGGAFWSAYSVFQGTQTMFKTGPSLSGAVNLLMGTYGIATGVALATHGAMMLHGLMPAFSNPAAWAIAGAVLAGSIAYGSINSMVQDGVTPGGVITTAVATLGMAVLTNVAIMGLSHMAITLGAFTGPIGWGVAAGVILFSVFWSIFHPPPSETIAMRDITKAIVPMIWSGGPLLFVAAGTAALLMGWPKGYQAPVMASITMPQSYVTRALGAAIPMGTSQAPTILVEHGDGTAANPGRVVIVSPQGVDSKGNSILQLKTFTLAKNLEFVSSSTPPQRSYIPFFIYQNGKAVPNPDVTQALSRQDSLLRSILSGGLDAQEALTAMQLAAATNKYGVTPAY